MKVFHCDHCGHLLFFENIQCVRCGHLVAYLPDLSLVGSLDEDRERPGRWLSPLEAAEGRPYRLCANYVEQQVCNWAIPDGDPNALCVSCRLTRVIPDLGPDEHRQAWYRLEAAKRRLIFTLLQLGLPVENRHEGRRGGLVFEFKADLPDGTKVLTGHANGVITVNIAEADDAERERRRASLNEPYRTLVGHFRHEIGHYYWDRLIKDGGELEGFRRAFGDERSHYGRALKAYYDQGPPADWQCRFISAYASAHPLEDWAETWAHYLHMVDTLETSASCGMSLSPRRRDEPSLDGVPRFLLSRDVPFEQLIDQWFSVMYVLNNLNRGLGLADAYPFVWSPPAVAKLRYVHELVQRTRRGQSTADST